jgi:hypothetical protein
MNAHSVAKLYFIKNDPANVRELSAIIPVQKIVWLNLFAAFLCDKGEDYCNGPVKLDTKLLFESVSHNDRSDH